MRFPFPLATAIEPGMKGFYRIDHDLYHSGPGVSSTKVKKALKSFRYYSMKNETDTAALAFGRAFHCSVLEPKEFAANYVVEKNIPGNKNSNAYKAEKLAWLESTYPREVISIKEHNRIREMTDSLRAHPEFSIIGYGTPEIMAVSECAETGLQIKCKMDVYGGGGGAIVDLKTTSAGTSPSEFMSAIIKYGYHISAAFYQDIVTSIDGTVYPFIIVPISNRPPYDCEFYELSDEVLAEGRKLYKAALRRIAKWNRSDKDEQLSGDKYLRTLHSTSRLVYSTKANLEFIGEDYER